MSEDLQKTELIERYIRGELNREELVDFEEKLETNSDFREEVNVFKDILLGSKLHGKNFLKAEVKKIHKKLQKKGFFESFSSNESKIINMKNESNSNKSKTGMGKILGIAATIALLLFAGYFFYNKESAVKNNYSDIFEKIYTPENIKLNSILDDLSSVGMAASDDPQADSLAVGLTLYKEYKYEETRSYLAAFVEKYPDDHIGKLYLGLSLLQQSEYAKASRHLQEVSQVPGFEHKDVADWYLAQCYLMYDTEKGKEFAKKLFNQIANNAESPYQKEAAFARDQIM